MHIVSGSQHLGDLIPCVQNEEKKKIQSAIAGRQVSVIFDGTTKVCEAMVIILRFIDDSWNVNQRVIHFNVTCQKFNGMK